MTLSQFVHENIHELASLRFLQSKSGIAEHKNEKKKHVEDLFFFFHETMF